MNTRPVPAWQPKLGLSGTDIVDSPSACLGYDMALAWSVPEMSSDLMFLDRFTAKISSLILLPGSYIFPCNLFKTIYS